MTPYLIGIAIGFPAGAAAVYGWGCILILRKKLKVSS